MAGDAPPDGPRSERRRREEDPWADAPDRFDKADREWDAKWADRTPQDSDEVAPPRAGYVRKKATPGAIHDAYGDGMREAGNHLGTGMQIAASMLFFVGIGIGVDRWLDTTPWGTLVGAALGMVGIVALVVRMANEANTKR